MVKKRAKKTLLQAKDVQTAILTQAEILQKKWGTLNETERQAAGETAKEQGWPDELLALLGLKPMAETSLVMLWPYLKSQKLLDNLIEKLASPNEFVQTAVARTLKEIADPLSIPGLLGALLQPRRFLPARVAEAMSGLGSFGAKSLEALFFLVEAEKRPLILQVLGQMGKNCLPQLLITALKDENKAIRLAAIEAVEEAKPSQAAEILGPVLLLDVAEEVRARAALALGELDDPEAKKLLEMGQEDRAWLVVNNCKTALARSQKATSQTAKPAEQKNDLDLKSAGM